MQRCIETFSGDPTVAAVWRRQTFSAAVDMCSSTMMRFFLAENIPTLTEIIFTPANRELMAATSTVLETAYNFTRMVHGAPATSDAFYRAFVPEIDSPLDSQYIELVKRCIKLEEGQDDRVGATVFPGLVKVTRAPPHLSGELGESRQTIMRRAQVVCQCALGGPTSGPYVHAVKPR